MKPSERDLEAADLIARGETYESVARRVGWGRTTLWRRRRSPEFSALVDQMRSISSARVQGILARRSGGLAETYCDWMIGLVSLSMEQVKALERFLFLRRAGAEQEPVPQVINVYPGRTGPPHDEPSLLTSGHQGEDTPTSAVGG